MTWNRKKTTLIVCATAGGLFAAPAALGQWVEFEDQTDERLIAEPEFGAEDSAEKDYQWADLNKNGWIDLVVMRRTANNGISGQRQNTLFMNEKGVLVDRTVEYASASDVEGDAGFLTPVSDRQAVIVDVDNDGWLDVVTAPSLNNGLPKHRTHPRVYMNLQDNASGDWLGLMYEDDRIPVLACCDGDVPHAPRLCGIASGDVTGDGYADLYFTDYSSGFNAFNAGAVCSGCPSATFNFNDLLLVNSGASNPGHFVDETTDRVQTSWPVSGSPSAHISFFGTHALIADFNNNDVLDIAKISTLGGGLPYAVRIMYNDPDNEGHFVQSHQPSGGGAAPYFIMAADLNNNGRLDLVVADDGIDRVAFNQGNQSSGMVSWSPAFNLPNTGGGIDFRSNIVTADLNNDGFKDILTASVDIDLYGWNRLDGFHRNNAEQNPNVTFTWDSGNIPTGDLTGGYDFAVYDINGNGWNDMVRGWGTSQFNGGQTVYINQPQFGINITFDDQPSMLTPELPTDVVVEFAAFPSDETVADATLHYSIDGGEFQSVSMTNVGGDEYAAALPGVECASTIEYYFEGELESGFTVTEPANAPASTFSVTAADGTEVTFTDDISGDVSGWSIENDPSLESGAWEQADPTPVLYEFPTTLAQPDGPNVGTMAFITENCPDDSDLMGCSVSLGPTYLVSPALNIEGFDAIISYDRWFFCNHEGLAAREDTLVTEVSNDDGQSWTLVHETTGTDQQWESVEFVVSHYVEPTNQVRVRFSVEDAENTSVTNAVIDNISVEEFTCGDFKPACPGDVTGSDVVDVDDLLVVLNNWGPCADPNDCPGDITGTGVVDVDDLLVVLNNWGPCPE